MKEKKWHALDCSLYLFFSVRLELVLLVEVLGH